MSSAVGGVAPGVAEAAADALASRIRTNYRPNLHAAGATQAVNSAATPIYMFGGHGHEEDVDFEARDIVPEGVTLVTLSEFGSPTIVEEICPFQAAFAIEENRKYFENPRRYQRELDALVGRPIHIYEAGDPYPKLYASLSSLFSDTSDINTLWFQQSGVLPFPLQTPLLRPSEPDLCQSLADSVTVTSSRAIKGGAAAITEFVTRSYKHSVFPTATDIQAYFDVKPSLALRGGEGSLEKKVEYPISRIFEEVYRNTGKGGVFYHVICRAARKDISNGTANYPRIQSFEEIIKAILIQLPYEFPDRKEELRSVYKGDLRDSLHSKLKNLLSEHLNRHLNKNEQLTAIIQQMTALKDKYKPTPRGIVDISLAISKEASVSDQDEAKILIKYLIDHEAELFSHELADPIYLRQADRTSKYEQFLGRDQRKNWLRYIDQVIAFVTQDMADFAVISGGESEFLQNILRQLNTLKTRGTLIRQKSQEFQNFATKRAINKGLRNARRSSRRSRRSSRRSRRSRRN